MRSKTKTEKKISRRRRPADMDLENWQIALRRQYGAEQNLRLKNVGTEPIFSEFRVANPKTGGRYRVAIRGMQLGENYCSCPDFAINALGTCKHIEFTLSRLKRKRGGSKALLEGFRQPYSEVFLRYGARRHVMFKRGSECPTSFMNLADKYFDDRGRLRDKSYEKFHLFLRSARKIRHDLRCYDDAVEFIAHKRDHDRLPGLVARKFPTGIHSGAFRGLLKISPYPFQKKGALFAAQAGRCLIADEMGLGKTVQSIAAAEILARCTGLERVLVICPTSLKYQWKQEIERFSDRSAAVVEGSLTQRLSIYSNNDAFYKITNYDVVHRDAESIQAWAPEMIVLDEAQRIKNWQTRTAQSVKNLEAKYALVLTGTPLENRLEELHSIVEFVDRYHLGARFRFLAEHQQVEETGRVVGYSNLSRISRTLEPMLIRRTKKEVLKELPERLDKNYFMPMTKEQWQLHEDNRETAARIVAKWRRWGHLSDTDQKILRGALENMRMSCDSTYLLDGRSDHGVKADELMVVLDELLEQDGSKAVVFSQWLRMHELLSGRLKSRRRGHVFFHGGVVSRKRQELIRQFKEDPGCRVFLSTDAGGVGLNLQNAAAVVNVDLPWNPAVLEQRVGRVHRLGQRRPVRVISFVAQGTIEHSILSLLSFKKAMFAGVLDGGQDEVFLGGTRLKRFMESVDKATSSIPEPMPAVERGGDEGGAGAGGGSRGAMEAPEAAGQPGWDALLSAGLLVLEKFGKALGEGHQVGVRATEAIRQIKLEKDQATGRVDARIPLPPKETLTRIADVIHQLAKRL